tara:strand:+ start:46 stop:636 length:591 start_codon:yes stop_codon:yes gene_type:complete
MNRKQELRIQSYTKAVWPCFLHAHDRWNNNMTEDDERAISRQFYQAVFDTGPDRTGFATSERALYADSVTRRDYYVDDHFYSPQRVAKYILDNPNICQNYDKFYEIFLECRKTILVTKEENQKLSSIVKKFENVLTKDKYHYLDMLLHNKSGVLPEDKQVLNIFPEFTEWERQFIDNDYRPLVVSNHIPSPLEAFF